MNSLKVLDVTLRDGGCVNDFCFGQDYMNRILHAVEDSGVEYIELGYLDNKKGSEQGRTQYCSEQVIPRYFLKQKKPGVCYVAMMDYGKFDVDAMQPRTESGIDGIRLAFHKKDRKNMIALGRKIMEKGYRFFVQPMITLRYTDAELLELIESVNRELPEASGFYIVDTFGEMRPNDMNRILSLVDHNLKPEMPLGFHSHNNLQLSYSNAITLLQFPTNRDLMLDCSVMGMGKGAGNLNTELLLEHLNLYYGKKYRTEPLLKVIDQVLNQIRAEHYWGYSVEYYLSAVNRCTPSYAGHFYGKHMLPIEQVSELLGRIREDKKISFDREYAEQLYLEYNSGKAAQDDASVSQLKQAFCGKRLLLVAPGKSMLDFAQAVGEEARKPDTVSIALNNWSMVDTDYVFITRADVLQSARASGKKVITTSSLAPDGGENLLVIDYQKWILVDGEVQDSSGILAINLARACGASRILLAGFDGFHVNMNKNYFDKAMGHPTTAEQAQTRNAYFRKYVCQVRQELPVEFLTPSLYESGDRL